MSKFFWLCVAVAFLMAPSIASAQATRTWVSGTGDDVNPCSRTAPCKTFAGAISKTAAGGEISVLDPGGFGAVTITKSISIVAAGAEGSILAVGTTGVTVSAGLSDTVSLRGLSFEGVNGGGVSGISVQSAGDVQIENCAIRGFQTGVTVSSGSFTRVHVLHSSLLQNRVGASIQPTGTAPNGFVLESSSIDYSGTTGIVLNGSSASLLLSDSSILASLSGTAIDTSGTSATVQSFGNNRITGAAPAFSPVGLK